jgi:predicted GNAT superfamily acetyltransferase
VTATIRTPAGTDVVIRRCESLDELDACVELQVQTWGYNDGDVIPRRMFIVAQRIGGQVMGAFKGASGNEASSSDETMVGFAMSLPGVKSGKEQGPKPMPYLHSHMLAVKSEYRNAGIGRKLKLFQRDEALARGIRLMEWTFDPLEIKNAFLNIHRLGVIVRSYTPNFYGVSSSRLQGGLPTDRLVAEWYLDSDRVSGALEGHHAAGQQIEERILVPAAIYEWKASPGGREHALAVQVENRRRFQEAFQRGLAVVGFARDAEGNGVFELGQWARPA